MDAASQLLLARWGEMIHSMIEEARDTLEHLPLNSHEVARTQGRIQVLRQFRDPLPLLREWLARKETH